MNSLSRTLDETFPLKTVLIATLSPSRRNSSSRTSGTFCRLPGDQRLRRSPWTMCMRSCWTSNAWRTETLLCRSVCFAFSDARRSTSSETKRRLSRRLCRLVAARVAVASMVSGELSFTDYGEFFIWILILIKGIFETFQSLSSIEIQNLFEKSFKKHSKKSVLKTVCFHNTWGSLYEWRVAICHSCDSCPNFSVQRN